MSTICIIPARGGSKGIPRKNLQDVGGTSLLARAIRTVRESGTVDEIIVSTDDAEIAEHAVAAGARLVRRPADLAADGATSEAALLHALETVGLARGRLLFVQATTPLLEPADLVDLSHNHDGHDSSLTVTKFHGFLWRQTAEQTLIGVNHDQQRRFRRQDLGEQEFLENGAAYLMDIAGFLAARHRFFGRIGCSVMPKLRSIEVDDADDLTLVRQIHDLLYGHGRSPR